MLSKIIPAIFLVWMVSCKNSAPNNVNLPIERNGDSIAYNACGAGDTTLLFIHGWCINKEYWESQLRHFCNRYRCVAIDLPGFGESGKSRANWNFDEYAADVALVIEKLALRNVIVIGHSMSGDIILKTAVNHPSSIIGLVGVDNLHFPGTAPDEATRRQNDTLFSRMATQFDSTIERSVKGGLFIVSTQPQIVGRVMNDIFNCDSVIATNVFKAMSAASEQEQDLMKRLPVKLFLVNSDTYPVEADSLNKYCKKGFEVFLIRGSGHYPMIEKPDEFNAAMEQVLERVRE